METTFITPLLLLILSIGMGAMLRSLSKQTEKLDQLSDKLAEQNVTLATISTTLSSVVVRVDALDRWKDMVQQRENDDLRALVDELKSHRPSV